MLNWETVDPTARYPRPRHQAARDVYDYQLMAQHDGWWHLLVTWSGNYVTGINYRSLAHAKHAAEMWEAQHELPAASPA